LLLGVVTRIIAEQTKKRSSNPWKDNIFFSSTQLQHWICSPDRFLDSGDWGYTEASNSTMIRRERKEIKLSWPTLQQSP